MSDPGGTEDDHLRPYARLGREMRAARERKAVSLRQLGRELHTTHSNLHDYEMGFRLAPHQIVEEYETKLDVASGSLRHIREEVAWAHAQGQSTPRAPSTVGDASEPASAGQAGRAEPPTLSRRRRGLILIAALGVVGGAFVLRSWNDGHHTPVDLARVGDRLTVGDYNGDGKSDLALASDLGGGKILIDRWTSDGIEFTQTSSSRSEYVGAIGGRIASGDVNGDGRDDIVMASQDGPAFAYHVWLSGDAYAGRWYVGSPLDPAAINDRFMVGEFNGDGKADAALAYDVGGGAIQTRLWTSNGSEFTEEPHGPSEPVRVTEVAGRVAAGDVTGDHRDDIVMADQLTDGRFHYHVWSAGESYVGVWYTSGSFNLDLVGDRFNLGDYTGDGGSEAALAYDRKDGDMRIYRWTANGSEFVELPRTESPAFAVANVAGRMGSGDVNGDGRDDLVMVHQNSDGTFSFYVWSGGSGTHLAWYTSTQ